jgi:hypothetical protein
MSPFLPHFTKVFPYGYIRIVSQNVAGMGTLLKIGDILYFFVFL